MRSPILPSSWWDLYLHVQVVDEVTYYCQAVDEITYGQVVDQVVDEITYIAK